MSTGAGPWVHRDALVNGVRLHYVECGSGPLVVLLHGFPEFWYAWRHQIPALAAAGFRVVALDQRGYNTSAKPRGVCHQGIDGRPRFAKPSLDDFKIGNDCGHRSGLDRGRSPCP
jgi:pimeloyl-ACP methyl ester carboxylesterase